MPLPSLDMDELAAAQHACKDEMDGYFDVASGLRPSWTSLPSGSTLLCDLSLVPSRPIIPKSWTRRVFDCVHGMSHPGSNATLSDVRRRYVWTNMSSDVRRLCRDCVSCQRSKIHRHTRAPLQDLPLPSRRFEALNIDLVLSLIHI